MYTVYGNVDLDQFQLNWQTYPILNIKPKLTEYFIHFIIHSKTFWFLIIRYGFSLFNFLSNFRHRYKCEALFHHDGDTFCWKTDENETGWRQYFELAFHGTLTDHRALLLDLSNFVLTRIPSVRTEFQMNPKESTISNSDRDRRQRRLREIKTKGMDWPKSSYSQQWLSTKIAITMRIYPWTSRHCRNWTESLFEASKRVEEAKRSWITCWTSGWEIVFEMTLVHSILTERK